MALEFKPGDFLVFQVESGYGLLRLLGISGEPDEPVWHVAAYSDLFLDVPAAESAAAAAGGLKIEIPHVALTNRAFESTQVAAVGSRSLAAAETAPLDEWRSDPSSEVVDRSIRLLLGLR